LRQLFVLLQKKFDLNLNLNFYFIENEEGNLAKNFEGSTSAYFDQGNHFLTWDMVIACMFA
jgi:hypothetical protein